MRRFVFPGEMILNSPTELSCSYIDNDKTYSKVLGLFDESSKSLIPLKSVWVPHIDDKVIGVISDIGRNGSYSVEINPLVKGVLLTDRRERQRFYVGDIVEATVKEIEHKTTVVLERAMLLKDGILMHINTAKIPRLMGKENTMINELTSFTKTKIAVGKNGYVWIKGENANKAIDAVLRIESEAHVPGLTDRIKDMLENENKE
ncbi:exosome complex RNA-binding protein Rrp4 [Candidatus Mancarchaeum acidiphilum]|uniref:Exosome complex RNA-binding protein Rrp4 n=1 Tax=Candidatus Mancarchaeum acidiphilum TaxID=1920749 RepID=A0A218NLQ2_9ARCH|nr:KH domain-containing protein [Candidatus Mancarchaeum acidiphilum]ASI13393.1 exosome complex RNA-binding protein Rrp4 [Candidatus Mancarchaeum acidiphilum]